MVANLASPSSYQELYRLLMDLPAIIAVVKGPEHVLELANRSYRKMMERDREIVGRPVAQTIPSKHIVEILNEVYCTGIPYHNEELRVVLDTRGDGHPAEAFFCFTCQPLKDATGSVEGVFVHGNDITAQVIKRKRLEKDEEQLRNMVMHAPVPIGVYVGREMRIHMANEAILKTWNRDRSVVGKTFIEALPEMEGQPFLKLLDDVYTTGIPYTATEDEVKLLRGDVLETRYFNFTYKPLYDDHGRIYGIMNTAAEVTELVLARNSIQSVELEMENQVKTRTIELEKLNDHLRHTNEQLKQFAYVASHDLQEPLRKINIFSDRLLRSNEDNVDEPGKVYLNKIMNSAKRMSHLIQDLLNFSKLDARNTGFCQTDLNEIAEQVKGDYEIMINEKNAEIIIDRLAVIEAAPLQINQLFYNLIGNALKFSRDAVPPVVRITSRFLTHDEVVAYPDLNPDHSYCEIIFSDNGIGFDQQFSTKIFEIFQRLHGKDVYEGTGIGLALCKKIVEYHHGEIYAMSQLDEGSSFHIILPISRM